MSDESILLSSDIRTPSGFASAVKTMSPSRFAEAVSVLTEPERKKLSKLAQDLVRDYRRELSAGAIDARLQRAMVWLDHTTTMHFLALLAVAPKAVVKRDMELSLRDMQFRTLASGNMPQSLSSIVSENANPTGPEVELAAIRILCDRRPDWADEWLTHQIENARGWSSLSWNSVRTLIKSGVCQRPASHAYVQLFCTGAIAEDFTSQPDLLDDIWLYFRFASGVFITLELSAAQLAMFGQQEAWAQKIVALVKSGYLDRQRLHAEILRSLWNDWPSPTLTAMSKFHDFVQFTEEECVARQQEYIYLLANPVPTVVGWTIRQLKTCCSHTRFDAEAVLESLPHVFKVTTKAQPVAALSLLGAIVKAGPQRISVSGPTIIRAMTHEVVDVQETALKLVESWHTVVEKGSKRAKKATSTPVMSPLVQQMHAAIDRISPLFHDRIESLYAVYGNSASADSSDLRRSQVVTQSSNIADLDQQAAILQSRIESLPTHLRDSLQLRNSFAAACNGQMLPEINVDDVPCVLAFVEKVRPIESVEELLDSIAAALENVSSPMEIERILDGIGRFGKQYPEGFTERAAPLVARLNTQDQRFTDDSLRTKAMLLPKLASLLSLWLSEEDEDCDWAQPSWIQPHRSMSDQLLNHRTEELARRLKKNEATGPMLSLPTHEHGWIDPRVFVRRLKTQAASGVPLCRIDFCTALLRLAPDFREEALADTEDLTEDVRSIIRYALGAEPEFDRSSIQWAPEWLAAGRSRSPHSDLLELRELPMPAGPNLIEYGRVEFRIDRVQATPRDRYLVVSMEADNSLQLVPSTPNMAAGPRLIPAMLTAMVRENGGFFCLGWNNLWQASFWPARPELVVAQSIPAMLMRLDRPASVFERTSSLLKPLLYAERNWSDVSLFAMCIAFLGRDAEARSVAADALVEGILDGRAHPERLGIIFSKLASCPWAKMNRLTEALENIGRVSHWAALVTSSILESLIAAWDEVPRDAHLVLSQLLELLISLRRSPSAHTVSKLQGITGKTRTGTVATRLLTLQTMTDDSVVRRALFEGVQARVERAERSVVGEVVPALTFRIQNVPEKQPKANGRKGNTGC